VGSRAQEQDTESGSRLVRPVSYSRVGWRRVVIIVLRNKDMVPSNDHSMGQLKRHPLSQRAMGLSRERDLLWPP